MKEGECDSFACVNADLYGKQIFYCANNCTISLYICRLLYGTETENMWPLTVSVPYTVWQNLDQERGNQNAQIYLKTTMPHNKCRCCT